MPPRHRAQAKCGNESNEVQVQPPRQGAPADTAETMPLQPPDQQCTDSQPPEGYFSVKGGNQLVSAGEENMLEEGAEEEQMTDDEMVEPVRTHEQVEKEDEETVGTGHAEETKNDKVEKRTEVTEPPAPQDVPTKTEGTKREEQDEKKPGEEDPKLKNPTSPATWPDVIDSDEEINSPDKKNRKGGHGQKKKEEKSAFQEAYLSYLDFVGDSDLNYLFPYGMIVSFSSKADCHCIDHNTSFTIISNPHPRIESLCARSHRMLQLNHRCSLRLSMHFKNYKQLAREMMCITTS